MKLKISELLDQVADFCESNNCPKTEIDLSKIEKRVLTKIHSQPKPIRFRKRRKFIIALAAALVAVTGSVVIAKTLLPSGGIITEENADDITEHLSAYSSITSAEEDLTQENLQTEIFENDIISKESAIANQLPDSSEIVEISVKEKNGTIAPPDLYMDNGCMIILKNGDTGYTLKKDTEITFKICPKFADSTNSYPIHISLGYVLDGNYNPIYDIETAKESGTYTFTVPHDGIYYFTLINTTLDRIILYNSSINL
jgi:hypothetical protein